jgi:hypothetical protein
MQGQASQLLSTTSEPPRGDAEEGWKKVKRKKGKGEREKKVGTRSSGGVPTSAVLHLFHLFLAEVV